MSLLSVGSPSFVVCGFQVRSQILHCHSKIVHHFYQVIRNRVRFRENGEEGINVVHIPFVKIAKLIRSASDTAYIVRRVIIALQVSF